MAASGGKPTMLSLTDAISSIKRLRQIGVLPQRDLDILGYGLVAEQRAVLEQHAPADLHPDQLVAVDVGHILAQHFDPASSSAAAVR